MKLSDFQVLNDRIYRISNDRIYSAQDMAFKIGDYAGMVLKAVRKEEPQFIGNYLVMGLSWTMALCNRMHIDIDAETWKRFPGKCPYCSGRPCGCKQRRKDRLHVVPDVTAVKPESLSEYQHMFREIYPHNTLEKSASHHTEEFIEVGRALAAFARTLGRERGCFDKICLELVDVVANNLAVASCAFIDFEPLAVATFANGCPECHKVPCKCGFTDIDHVNSCSADTP